MEPEQQEALLQGGRLLELKQQLDTFYEQLQDHQNQQEYQLQSIMNTGNSCLGGGQILAEVETLLGQLKDGLPQGKGLAKMSTPQLEQLSQDLCQKINQEEATARQELHNALHQAARSLLQGLELTKTVNRLGGLGQVAQKCQQLTKQVTAVNLRGYQIQSDGDG